MRRRIILCSCVVCYFFGLWNIASRFGITKILMRYGVSDLFDEFPKNFPQMEYLWVGIAAYTLLFLTATWIIYRVTTKAEQEQSVIQDGASEIRALTVRVDAIYALYRNYAATNGTADLRVERALKHIQRQIAALPASVTTDRAVMDKLSDVIESVEKVCDKATDYQAVGRVLDAAVGEINQIRMKNLIISYSNGSDFN